VLALRVWGGRSGTHRVRLATLAETQVAIVKDYQGTTEPIEFPDQQASDRRCLANPPHPQTQHLPRVLHASLHVIALLVL
jgi:hypothetical protein